MIACGGIGNPWLLHRCVQAMRGEKVDQPPTRQERARIAIEHLKANVKIKGERRGVLEMRKVVRNYIKGYLDSKRTWMRIIEEESESKLAAVLEEFGNGNDELAVYEARSGNKEAD